MFFVAILCVGVPVVIHAQVLISEIAWMGTDEDSSNEWIELYNFSSTSTDLTGWVLISDDDSVSIALSGVLTPHGVGLLERESDESVPGVTAMLTYSGVMEDDGGELILKDPEGAVADQAAGGISWLGIGGSINPVKTAQRTRTGTWVTAAPTPGLDNAQVDDPLPPDDVVIATTSTTTTQEVVSSGTTKNNGSGGSSSKRKNIFSINLSASTTAYVGKPTTFSVTPSGLSKTRARSVLYYWNFGDTKVGEGDTPTHSFEFPGEYVVMVEASSSDKQTYARHDIKVLPHALSLLETEDDDIAITNMSNEEVTLDGYTISGDKFELVFPRNSILKSKSTITLAHTRIGNTKKLEITDLDNFLIASLSINENKHLATTSAPSLTEVTVTTSTAGAQVATYVNKTEEAHISKKVNSNFTFASESNQNVISVASEHVTTQTKTIIATGQTNFGRILASITNVFGF